MNTHTDHLWLAVDHKPVASVRPVEIATAVLLVVLAVVLRWAPARSRSTNGGLHDVAITSARWVSGSRRPTLRQVVGSALSGCAVGLFIGGLGGVFAGLLAALGALTFSSRRVSERETRARNRLIAAAPPAVDLFAAALSAGLLPVDAASVVASAFAEPDGNAAGPVGEIAERFGAAARALRDGRDPEAAWRHLSADSATAPVAAAALRSCRTGAPASTTVAKAARDTWNAAEQAAQAQIRAVAVRATAPLALCFLPAFILVGVVPTALGLLAEFQS
jgi:Type II secretion system (T2SS), protein F